MSALCNVWCTEGELAQSPMGSKALTAYLGEDKSAWKQYDATEVAKTYNGPSKKILIDQGTSDNFWKVRHVAR